MRSCVRLFFYHLFEFSGTKLICSAFLLTLIGCENSISGNWDLTVVNGNRNINISRITFYKDSIEAVDRHGIVSNYAYYLKSNNMTLFDNKKYVDTFKIERKNDTTLIIEGNHFKPSDTNRSNKNLNISLPEIKTGTPVVEKQEGIVYNISIRSIDDSLFQLQLGDRISKIKDLPFFLECYHCESIKKSGLIFIDRNVRTEHFYQLLLNLDYYSVGNIKIVTHKDSEAVFQGFNQRLVIWQDQRNIFIEENNLPFPSSIGLYRDEFISDLDSLCLIDLSTNKQDPSLEDFICVDSINLINIHSIKYIKDYLRAIDSLEDLHKNNLLRGGSKENDSSLQNLVYSKKDTRLIFEYFKKE